VTPLRRLDHVAIVVADTEKALVYFRDRLGLAVASTDEIGNPPVRLTYLDAGNAFVQLVEPLQDDSEIAQWLAANGEGLHHICFGVDDVPAAVEELAGRPPATLGSGRGRISAFLPGGQHGTRIECTEFRREDVDGRPGYLN
jgi:methylmalonyl-CoA/ethylmalonyl-CoA epimerase